MHRNISAGSGVVWDKSMRFILLAFTSLVCALSRDKISTFLLLYVFYLADDRALEIGSLDVRRPSPVSNHRASHETKLQTDND